MYGCIYKLTNNINGLIYIGQTINLTRRLKEYKIKKITKKSQKYLIMYEIVKHGYENFSIEILAKCKNKKEMDDLEKYYIALYKSREPDIGYNSKVGGTGGVLRESSREKMSNTSKKFKHSYETKAKKSSPIIVYKNGIFKEFIGAKSFSDYISSNKSNVTYAVRNAKTVKGHLVFYKDIKLREEIFNRVQQKNEKYIEVYNILFKEDLETIEKMYIEFVTSE